MKTSISSDVWEKKKALIAKLYMEEEWPLKQVIKQIRSDDFNPSETQLRSRLKKWRVTKPSRQTRKRLQDSEDGDSDKDTKESPSTSPRNQRPSPLADKVSTAHSDWTGTLPVYTPTETQSQAGHQHHAKLRAPLLAQQLTPSLSAEHGYASDQVSSFADPSTVTTSFEQSAQTSPAGESFILNTTAAMAPTTYAAYPLSPDSYITSPGSTAVPALAQWPPRSFSADMGLNSNLHAVQWYNMPFEPISPPPGVPHSAPLAPPASYRDQTSLVIPPPPGVFPPDFAHYTSGPSEYHGYDTRPSKRAMSLQYDFTNFHAPDRPDQTDRKDVPSPGVPIGMLPLSPYHHTGPHPGVCAPITQYMSHESMMQKHSSLGY